MMSLSRRLFLLLASGLLQQRRPTVTVYTAPGCQPCKLALADLTTVANVIEQRDCPWWVTQVPTLTWRVDTAAGAHPVQHAPSHWKAATWRGEWPRVRQLQSNPDIL